MAKIDEPTLGGSVLTVNQLIINTMNLDGLKGMAGGLMDKAKGLVGEEKINEAKEWINSEKGKEVIEETKEKITEFVSEKFSKKK